MGELRGRVGVVGLGYVGLSTALCFASRGFMVTGVDVDVKKLEGLGNGKVPFSEKGAGELLRSARRSLDFTDDFELASRNSEAIFITVGTPGRSDGSVDLAQVKSAARSVGKGIGKVGEEKLVIVKSTVPPGTTKNTVGPILEKESGGATFRLAASPEFLREGSALADTFSPDRIVIGSDDEKSGEGALALYRLFYGRKMPPTLSTNTVNAEMIKYASNSFLASKISFINEVANLCSRVPGADAGVVARGMGMDGRIGARFLDAGLGFGGSCFPKDVRALLAEAEKERVELGVAEAALRTNELQPLEAVKLAEGLVGVLRGKRVAVLGLAFKPGTDDMREAVSLRLIRELKRRGSRVVAFDPRAVANARRVLGRAVEYGRSTADCLRGADCCIIVTEWGAFAKLKPGDFLRLMRNPAVVDGRRALEAEEFVGSGVKFAAVGRGGSR